MNKEYFVAWLKAAAIRAAKTFAQTAASLITVGALASEINWRGVVSISAVAFIYSMLTSAGGLPEVSGPASSGEKSGQDGQ